MKQTYTTPLWSERTNKIPSQIVSTAFFFASFFLACERKKKSAQKKPHPSRGGATQKSILNYIIP